METNEEYYNTLISKYFSGEATEEEIRILSLWTDSSASNAEIFESYSRSWEAVEKIRINTIVDTEAEWKHFLVGIHQRQTTATSPVREKNHRRIFLFRAAAIAAVLLILIVSSLAIIRLNQKPVEMLTLSAADKKTSNMLTDGSEVTLYPGSTLTYPKEFNEDKRVVSLTGEACFDVDHRPEQPFIIEAGDIRVEVLGTSFYVNTRNSSGKTEVILTSGSVAVYRQSDPSDKTVLSPGEKIEIGSGRAVPLISKTTDENYMAWKTGRLSFNNSTLKEVVTLLEKVYREKIVLDDPALEKCRITVNFNNQSLASVLTVIEATLDLTIKHSGDVYHISGKGCSE